MRRLRAAATKALTVLDTGISVGPARHRRHAWEMVCQPSFLTPCGPRICATSAK
jgi:hypothetical protein